MQTILCGETAKVRNPLGKDKSYLIAGVFQNEGVKVILVDKKGDTCVYPLNEIQIPNFVN